MKSVTIRTAWLPLGRLTWAEWHKVGVRIRARRIRHKNLDEVRKVIHEIEKERKP